MAAARTTSPRRVLVLEMNRALPPSTIRSPREPSSSQLDTVSKALAKHGVQVLRKRSQAKQAQAIVVLGGDGTILSAAEIAREYDIPLLGINTGHVGFLAQAEPAEMLDAIEALSEGDYTVEPRMTLAVSVRQPNGDTSHGWALNEAALERRDRAHMAEISLGIDGHAVSSFGCDGLITATPTGSTAYAFSCGGPVVWPDTQAMLVVPVAAHALFTRPLVIGPHSRLEVQVQWCGDYPCEIWCDGRRSIPAPAGSTVSVSVAQRPVKLIRIGQMPFSARLVAKFELPVRGWRESKSR